LTLQPGRPQPNSGHRALVELERDGRLDTLITQNIDGLHHLAGQDPARVIEIHGTMREVVCLVCADRRPMEHAMERVRQGDADPRCLAKTGGLTCGGLLKSATISFGQSLVVEDLARAEAAARSCDVMLAVGSTLSVFPAAGVVPLAARAGAKVIVVNAEPTEMDALANVVLPQPISEVLPEIVAQ
jgi:NAD-dependent deacetylase